MSDKDLENCLISFCKEHNLSLMPNHSKGIYSKFYNIFNEAKNNQEKGDSLDKKIIPIDKYK
ncbi:hypothetical protein [Clostridioides difficile]|uniref:hypothetical protein n=1 Tax=Clostridioides difficile TaxID=1496 RepID=UPI001034BA79|nr:hypothetical protein [Clostridioides difficile]MDM9944035.1 hypothetical protein [Clostridioides difficile]